MPRKTASKELRELQAQVQQRLSQLSLLQQEQRELQKQHDALVAFVDLLGWLRDQHTKHEAAAEPGQQQQQPSLAAILGNNSELVLLDQLRYLPYDGSVNHAKPNTYAAAPTAAPAQRAGPGLHQHEDDDAVASHHEQRCAPQGDLMYWLRWLLAQPLHPQAHTITVEELTALYAQTLREMSLLLHQLDHGTGYNADSAAAAAEADSADIPQDPYERMGQLMLQHNHLMVSQIVAGRNHVLAAFSLVNPETGTARTEHDLERYKWAVQQIKLKPAQVSDIVGVMQVFLRIYTLIATQLRQLQLELGMQPVGVSNGADNIAAGGGGTSLRSARSTGTDLSSFGTTGTSSSSGCTESEIQPPSSMLQHLTESEAKAQKLRRLDLLLKKDAMIKTGIGMLLGGVLELPQLARLMVLMSYPLNLATFGITVVELHKQQMLEEQASQQQQQHGQQKQARRQQQATVVTKKRMSLVRRKLEACNISKI